MPIGLETTLTALPTARTATNRLDLEDPDEWGPGVETDGEER
ncbi:hypothetical protein [Natrinema longum]|nr:hypothetical protein [Natrinema longum]